MIVTILTVVASLVTIIVFFSHSQERIAKLEEYKENIVDNLSDKINELERKVQEQNCRISWLEGFLHSQFNGIRKYAYEYEDNQEKK